MWGIITESKNPRHFNHTSRANPLGYSYSNSKTNGKSFEDTAKEIYCVYNDYYCITERNDKDYINYTFFDPYIVMLTNGKIIDLFS